MSEHEHEQVPANPSDGDRIVCACGYSAEFVVLDDGLPGEWVDTDTPTATTCCPTRGSDGVKACVDARGRELSFDHDDRPPFFPPGFDRIWR